MSKCQLVCGGPSDLERRRLKKRVAERNVKGKALEIE